MKPELGARFCACAGQRPGPGRSERRAPLPAGRGPPAGVGTNHPASQRFGGPERLKTVGCRRGGGCKTTPSESRNSQLRTHRLRQQKSRGSERHQGLSGHLGAGSFCWSVCSDVSHESGDQLSQFAWDWDWTGAKRC